MIIVEQAIRMITGRPHQPGNRATNRSGRVGCSLVALAILALLMLAAWELCRSKTKIGNTDDIQQLPFAREIIADISPVGIMHYYFEIGKSGYLMAVSGTTDAEAARKLSELVYGEIILESVDAATLKHINYLVEDPDIIRAFGSEDWLVHWVSPQGQAYFCYRRSDGAFTLVISGGEDRRKKWFPEF